ncbi:conserved Plasmodium protein, unknown function [Plasmodium ovale]|uniref:Uncharacterized protein n=1 Tax=Plasmodium ovale TaxID=36330 RepID=A0A1C3KVW5_PLAOA|nr:conserved Plasmodium protein, unknown function [Plasmodium ovale]
MNKNFSDKSNEYGKRLLSASITREMKENEERINLKKLPVDNMEKNDFIAYMELTLENLIISRYLFDIRDERGSPMRNSIQITRFIIMKSRNHIMGTCVSNRVILCYCNDKESNIILQNLMEELKKNYSVYLKLEENIENHTRYIEKQLLSYIIQFTLVCKYLQCGKWIHIWDNMDTIIESKFVGNNKEKYFNCIGFKFSILNNDYDIFSDMNKCIHKIKIHLKVTINIYKVLPIGKDICENMYVYCLPRCSMKATILNNITCTSNNKKENFNYKNYWLDIHGYILNDISIEKIIQVKLYKGIFKYPQGVLLRDNIYQINIPTKKKDFFYICSFLYKFELLKKSQMKLLTHSDNLKFDTNSYVLMQTVNVETDTNRDFYSKLNKLCSNNFEDNNLRQEMLNKNVKETFYNNAYNMYGNTITGSMKSLNLNFNKQQKDEYIKCNDFKRDHVKNIDTFLRESSLNYRDNYGQSTSFSGKQEIWNNQHSQGESHDCVTVATDLLHKSAHHPNAVLRPPIIATTATTATGATRETYHQNEDKRLDAYLHAVTATYKSQMEDDARRDFTDVHMFEGLNAQVILSKEFQNFLDNTEEAALYTGGNNQTVDFDRRERKRPNFAVYNNQHSTGESNKNARP